MDTLTQPPTEVNSDLARSRPSDPQRLLEEHLISQACQLDQDGQPRAIRSGRDAGFIPAHFQQERLAELLKALLEQLDATGTIDPEGAILHLHDAQTIDDGDSTALYNLTGKIVPTLTIKENVGKLRESYAKRTAAHHNRRASLHLKAGDALKAADEMQLAQDALAEVGTTPGTLEKFDLYRFDPEAEPPPNVPTLFLDGIPVCNRGNIASLVSHKKMGKSRAARAILRAICTGGEHLGFTAPAGRVAYLDFEQSRADFYSLMRGVEEREEGRLLAYSLTGATIQQGRALVDLLARQDDLRAIVLDGWADLVASPNDDEESNELVRWAMNLAAQNDISILGLLHLNPGSETKSRGHLGSQLERKSETQLEIQTDGNDRIICAPVARHRPIFKDQGVRIAWSDEQGDFVRVEGTLADARRDERAEELTSLLRIIEEKTMARAWSPAQLADAIATAEGVSVRTGKTRIREMVNASLVRQREVKGNYISAIPRETAPNPTQASKQAEISTVGK